VVRQRDVSPCDSWSDTRQEIERLAFPVADCEWDRFVSHSESQALHPPFDVADIEELVGQYREWHKTQEPAASNHQSQTQSAMLRGELWCQFPGPVAGIVRDWRRLVFETTDPPCKDLRQVDHWTYLAATGDLAPVESSTAAGKAHNGELANVFSIGDEDNVLESLQGLSAWISRILGCDEWDATCYVLMGRTPPLPPIHVVTDLLDDPCGGRGRIVITVNRPQEIDKETLWNEFNVVRERSFDVERARRWTRNDELLLELCLRTPHLTFEERCRKWNSAFGRTLSVEAFRKRFERLRELIRETSNQTTPRHDQSDEGEATTEDGQ